MKRVRSRGFVLLEVMLAVGIFAIGVITLGKCVTNCLVAERVKDEDSRAARFLANRMAEIEAGSVPLTDSSTEDLKDLWAGMTLKTTRSSVTKKNEKGSDILGIYLVSLQITWTSDNAQQARELLFYVMPKQQL